MFKILMQLLGKEYKEKDFILSTQPFKEKLPTRIKMLRRINTLESEVEVLEETVKSELYKEFMNKLGEPMEIERLRNDNKNLRKKNKLLKEMLKDDKNIKSGKKVAKQDKKRKRNKLMKKDKKR